MNNAERIQNSKGNEALTLQLAREYNIKHLESFIVAMQPINKRSKKNSSYTKRGPGRYHQGKFRAEIRAALESQKEQQ